MIIRLIGITLLSYSLISCNVEEPEAKLEPPRNLQTEIKISPSLEGLVSVSATATDENYFTIYFEDGEYSEKIEDINGNAEHTYKNSGIFVIRTRAHLNPEIFIEKLDTITINLSSNTDTNGVPLKGYTSPLSYDGYTLVWQDEFEGNQLNPNDWNYEIGNGDWGWGNNELQYYRKENLEVKNGYLTITAKQQNFGNHSYTSSRITTKNKQSFLYGRVDIRAALPKGQGLWPALWMLGDAIDEVSWPACGEIDIMELVGGSKNGKSDSRVHGTVHWEHNGEHAEYGNSNYLSGSDFSKEFHVFSIVWDETKIRWYRDNILYNTIEITQSQMSEFHEKFFFIFNVAVGGIWPGSPDTTTEFPQKLHVDYIRVFQ